MHSVRRAAERNSPSPTSQLLDTHAVGVRREKMYRIDNHIACSVAGMTGAGCDCKALNCEGPFFHKASCR